MRSLLLLPLGLAVLSGCGDKRFLLDRSVPTKTAVIASELARYGLAPGQSQCAGRSLATALSVWELRQLSAALAARRGQGEGDAAALLRIVPQIRSTRIASEVARSFETCGIEAPALAPTALTELPRPTEAPPVEVPEPSAVPNGKVQNGPSDYRPSETLLQALEAYERGDLAGSARLAKVAADAGDSGAQQFLGGLYAAGQGVRADVPAAVRYYALAAEQGWSEAMNNLAKAYETGFGIPRDRVQALKWYLLASARATEDEKLVAGNMQALLADMNLADIEKAAAMARDWEKARSK